LFFTVGQASGEIFFPDAIQENRLCASAGTRAISFFGQIGMHNPHPVQTEEIEIVPFRIDIASFGHIRAQDPNPRQPCLHTRFPLYTVSSMRQSENPDTLKAACLFFPVTLHMILAFMGTERSEYSESDVESAVECFGRSDDRTRDTKRFGTYSIATAIKRPPRTASEARISDTII